MKHIREYSLFHSESNTIMMGEMEFPGLFRYLFLLNINYEYFPKARSLNVWNNCGIEPVIFTIRDSKWLFESIVVYSLQYVCHS